MTTSLKEIRGISLISANKSMVQGGQFEQGLQAFSFTSDSLPFVPTLDDWIVHNGRRYTIQVVGQYEAEAAWLLGAQCIPGRTVNQTFTVKAESLLSLTQGTTSGD